MTPARAHRIRPNVTLGLLAVAHAVNHAQAVLLPLIFIKIIEEFGVTAESIAFLSALGSISAGLVQLTFADLTRRMPRRLIMGVGGLLFGTAFALQGAATSFATFAVTNVASRIGGAPQHPVGNALLAEQFPPERRGMAISAHIAGGNVGTVVAGVLGAALIGVLGWRGVSVLFGVPAAIIALAILRWVRETGEDRVAAIAEGSVRSGLRTIWRDPTIRRIYLASIFGGGGRGLGTANLFALIYLTQVLLLPDSVTSVMYAGLVILSVPMPLVAGWLSDRLGRRPVIIGAYVGGAVGFLAFIAAGSSLVGLWIGLVIMGLFSFAESPQLQALLADVVSTPLRDVTFAVYFTLAFGVGSLWVALYGAIIQVLGEGSGLPVVFVLMAVSFLAAGVIMWPVQGPLPGPVPEVEPVESV
ncbi:MAG TPA: MFS transporter [Candidatus Limnocylindrales bacterium]|nr:MFS transporter [Candidatus Limnocylindrales bacterium]